MPYPPQCPSCFGQEPTQSDSLITGSGGSSSSGNKVKKITRSMRIQAVAFCLVFATVPALLLISMFVLSEDGIDFVDLIFGTVMLMLCGIAFWGVFKAITVKELATNGEKGNKKEFFCELCGQSYSSD